VINFFISVLVIILSYGFIKPFMMPKLGDWLTAVYQYLMKFLIYLAFGIFGNNSQFDGGDWK
jgi:hypothetical protein